MMGNDKKTSFTTEEFLNIATTLESSTTISDLLIGASENAGVTYSFYLHFPAIGAVDFNSSGILHPYNFPDTMVEDFKKNIKESGSNLVIEAALVKGHFFWFSDSLKEPLVSKAKYEERIKRVLDTIGDGLCCPLFGPYNRKGFAFVCFNRDKADFDPVMPYQIQALVQIMHVRYCQLLKGLQQTIDLTPRESEVLELISYGKTNPEIATILGISHRTVAVHASKIFVKLGTKDRVTAAMRAQTLNINI